MRLRIPGLALLLVASPPVLTAPASHGFWVQAVPEGPGETLLRETLARGSDRTPAAKAEALRDVSRSYPGTAVAGLAQLAAGLLLLEAGHSEAALPCLQHPDLERTGLLDHALVALARSQEGVGDLAGAAQSYMAVAGQPSSALVCVALFRGAEVMERIGHAERAEEALSRALTLCPGQQARALLGLARLHEKRSDRRRAAETYDRVDKEYPVSPQATEAARRLKALGLFLPSPTPEARLARDLSKAQALFEAGRYAEAVALFRRLRLSRLEPGVADFVRVRLGRALLALNRYREAEAELGAISAGSDQAAEAAFFLARLRAQRHRKVDGYETVAARFAGTPWGEEALAALANRFQKDARFDEALPYYQRLLEGYPQGRYVDRATWRVAWADYRNGRLAEAAQTLERAARLRSPSPWSAGFLYWAGRARGELGESERARQLLEETMRRFKYTYHGLRAQEALARIPAAAAAPTSVLSAAVTDLGSDIPEPQLTRIRRLLLIDRLDEALDELQLVPESPRVQATVAWIEGLRGRLRPAITAMRRAYPEYLSEAGDRLPPEVWRILYPLEFGDILQAKARQQGLDPALVAALICQESTFDTGAVSRAGARGLMQVIPPTGRVLARSLGLKYRRNVLHDPETGLELGTRYLRQMLDRFDGRVERALAAYNAGPLRVLAWTAERPEMPAEEFIESIPFTETRSYVMAILAGQHQYRRLYSLPAATGGGGERP